MWESNDLSVCKKAQELRLGIGGQKKVSFWFATLLVLRDWGADRYFWRRETETKG